MSIKDAHNRLVDYAYRLGVNIEYSGRHAEYDTDEAIIYIPKKYYLTMPGLAMLLHEVGHICQPAAPYIINSKNDLAGMRQAILWYENNAWDTALTIARDLYNNTAMRKSRHIQLINLIYKDRKYCMNEYTKAIYTYKKSAVKHIYEGYTLDNQ